MGPFEYCANEITRAGVRRAKSAREGSYDRAKIDKVFCFFGNVASL
jgi:hypothetical protein